MIAKLVIFMVLVMIASLVMIATLVVLVILVMVATLVMITTFVIFVIFVMVASLVLIATLVIFVILVMIAALVILQQRNTPKHRQGWAPTATPTTQNAKGTTSTDPDQKKNCDTKSSFYTIDAIHSLGVCIYLLAYIVSPLSCSGASGVGI